MNTAEITTKAMGIFFLSENNPVYFSILLCVLKIYRVEVISLIDFNRYNWLKITLEGEHDR